MKIIGVTGPSGAGKSMLADIFEKHAIPCIDADGVYHSLLIPPSPCLDALRSAFGDGIFSSDGSLDRAALRAIVFSSPEKLDLLNSTVLSFVLDRSREIIAELEAKGHGAVAFDAPTLIESGFISECDLVISVLCPTELRLRRIVARDGISAEAAMLRIRAQKDDSFYRSHSDELLINDGSPEQLEKRLTDLLLRRGFICGGNDD